MVRKPIFNGLNFQISFGCYGKGYFKFKKRMKEMIRKRATMKKLIYVIFILLFWAIAAHAADVTLAWNPNSESNLAGYTLYWDNDSGAPYANDQDIPLADLLDVANPTYTLQLGEGQWYFALDAYDTNGLHSDYSEEVGTYIDETPPMAPTDMTVTVTVTVNIQ